MIQARAGIFLLAVLLAILASACSDPAGRFAPAASTFEGAPVEVSPQNLAATATPSPPQPVQLPPPALVTVPADAFEAMLEQSGAAGDQRIRTSTIDADPAFSAAVGQILERIKRGEVVFMAPGGQDVGVKTAYVYQDLNGDGVQDLVVIVVADQGGAVSVSASSGEAGTAIQLAPSVPGEGAVQAGDVELDGLVEIDRFDGQGGQPVVLHLVGDRLEVVTGLE